MEGSGRFDFIMTLTIGMPSLFSCWDVLHLAGLQMAQADEYSCTRCNSSSQPHCKLVNTDMRYLLMEASNALTRIQNTGLASTSRHTASASADMALIACSHAMQAHYWLCLQSVVFVLPPVVLALPNVDPPPPQEEPYLDSITLSCYVPIMRSAQFVQNYLAVRKILSAFGAYIQKTITRLRNYLFTHFKNRCMHFYSAEATDVNSSYFLKNLMNYGV